MKFCMVPYLGGKQALCKKLIKLLPPIDSYKIYCEPFGGAASILLNKPKSKIEVYNDLDGNLVNLFMVVRDHPEKFLERFNLLLYSRELNSRWTQDFLKGRWPEDPVERAARYYYVFRSSFKGCLGPGWAFSRRGQGPISRLYASLKNIKEIAERLKDVYIDHNDFRNCIRNWDSPETVFYCDPPYWGSEQYYAGTQKLFSEQDHLDLHQLLSAKVNGKWLLTEADHPKVRELYADFFTIKKRTILGGKQRNTLRHLIIINYDISNIGLPLLRRKLGILKRKREQ